jgi:hypothetical protein
MRAGGSPMYEHWLEGVHPELRAAATEASRGIRLHDYARARNSSMVFAFNLFLPFPRHPLRLGAPFEDVCWSGVRLEWTPPGRLLGEIRGDVPGPREKATAIDALLEGLRPSGARVAVLVEVKLSEAGFTTCGGAVSPRNLERFGCDDAHAMLAEPQRCYLTKPPHQRRPRRYWEIFEAQHGSLAGAFPGVSSGPCPFRGHAQQLMRQHALAMAMEQEGLADEAWLLLLHHDHNPDVVPHFDAYQATAARPERLLRWPATRLLAAGPLPWAAWMRQRYFLEEA